MTEIDRRGFLKCMAWAGTGVAWTVAGGLLSGCELGGGSKPAAARTRDLYFVQISDSHIGFNKEANPDTNGTLQAAIERINKLPK
jgi:3',5'-cyclic-AMP phosphodiesterase